MASSTLKFGRFLPLTPRCPPSPAFRRNQHVTAERSALPRLVQPSMWEMIIPPSVRQKTKELFRPTQKRPSNPATYFIWIYLLIGSQAIRILGVKNEYSTYSRKADIQLEKLRDVVRRLQAGEKVDVEKALGTGVPEEEQAWEEAMRELESEERLWQTHVNKEKREAERRAADRAKTDAEKQDASPVNSTSQKTSENRGRRSSAESKSADKEPPFSKPGFY